jgi:alpha-beta hydrolase superfamily lysophospholipase
VPGRRTTWVLLVHGFRATREEALRILPTLARIGLPALVTTYRNDAGAPSSPDGLYHLGDTEWQDIEAGVQYARECGARGIVLFGWSMGGCLVETFLHRSPVVTSVRALILDSPILNWYRVVEADVRRRRLPRWCVPLLASIVEQHAGVDFRRLNFERPVGSAIPPTLLFHGAGDRRVLVASSDAFARGHADRVTYYRIEGVDHTLIRNANPATYESARSKVSWNE